MRESRHVFNPHRKSASYTEHTRRVVNPSPPLRDAVKQPRQLLSCTKCRERKVKVSLEISSNFHYHTIIQFNYLLILDSAIVVNHVQHAVRVVFPKNAFSSPKMVTMLLFSSLTKFVNFVPIIYA